MAPTQAPVAVSLAEAEALLDKPLLDLVFEAAADFDGSRYSGASGLTPNNTVFNVTGSSGARTLQAGGYFFGGTTRGNAPPNIGGHFKVTGHDYHAAGVFAGSQR